MTYTTYTTYTTGTTSATTWKYWQDSTYTTYTTGTTSATTASVSTSNEVWYVWAPKQVEVRELSEEEKKRHEEERQRMEQLAREAEERRKEQERKTKEAEEKALQLLLDNLTENQKAVYEATGAIPIECQSGRKYHIRKGISRNVHELDEKGHTARRLCFHPSDCPVYDVMLAQKLMLEVCEDEARKIANFS